MVVSDLLDLNEIRQLASEMGDSAAEIFPDLFDSLERDINRSVGEMHIALENSDSNLLRQASHRLRGSCASLGAIQAALACQELETIGQGGEIKEATPMVERLTELCSRSLQALRDFPL